MNAIDLYRYGQWLLDALAVLVCIVVILGGICRANMIDKRHAIVLVMPYLLGAGFSMKLLLDVLHQVGISLYTVVGVVAGLLHLFLTQSYWAEGVPKHSQQRLTIEKGQL